MLMNIAKYGAMAALAVTMVVATIPTGAMANSGGGGGGGSAGGGSSGAEPVVEVVMAEAELPKRSADCVQVVRRTPSGRPNQG